ncbi:glycosyltransferase family 2 protein [Nakamurella sp.]|uniref:glycosyltransferase family 2 protein n=1 Tax=Nakamurella sp. TaxID=1869182 RepID=UPI0037835293
MTSVEVSVIVPYYDDQTRLTLLLAALAQQRGGVRFEVVIADDGSPIPPTIPDDLSFACRVVRQPNAGFRAAAARNLGVTRARADLLLFLDGDTLPTAGYLRSMVDRLRTIDDGHGSLVVGRRRHADLRSIEPAQVLRFLRQDPATAFPAGPAGLRILDDPAWLHRGYARTDHLASAGEEDFRLVISAVLGLDRRLWQATGGFDGSFVGYGGEDWDLGWRSWLAGARMAHEPRAVAWHDGPDAAGRGTDPTVKNAESLRLARTVPLPSVRGPGLVLDQPDIVVRYAGPTTGTSADAAVVACVTGLLADVDAAVWFPRCADLGSAGGADRSSGSALPPLLTGDPRVHAGDVPTEIARRARHLVTVHRPLQLAAPLDRCCAAGEWERAGWLQIRRTRALNRNEPAPAGIPADPGWSAPPIRPIPDDVSLERWWAGW